MSGKFIELYISDGHGDGDTDTYANVPVEKINEILNILKPYQEELFVREIDAVQDNISGEK